MKLENYMEILKGMTLRARTEGKIEAAVTDDESKAEEYNYIVSLMHQAIQRHRSALGLYHEEGETKADVAELKEGEIHQSAMKLHVALVRSEVMDAIKGSDRKINLAIVREMLSELTRLTGTEALGKISSKAERQLVENARKAKEGPTDTNTRDSDRMKPEEDGINPNFDKPYWELEEKDRKLKEANQKALEARLRAAGKIL